MGMSAELYDLIRIAIICATILAGMWIFMR